MGCKNSKLIGSVDQKTFGKIARRRRRVKKDDDLSTAHTVLTASVSSDESSKDEDYWDERRAKVGLHRLGFEIVKRRGNSDFEISK